MLVRKLSVLNDYAALLEQFKLDHVAAQHKQTADQLKVSLLLLCTAADSYVSGIGGSHPGAK